MPQTKSGQRDARHWTLDLFDFSLRVASVPVLIIRELHGLFAARNREMSWRQGRRRIKKPWALSKEKKNDRARPLAATGGKPWCPPPLSLILFFLSLNPAATLSLSVSPLPTPALRVLSRCYISRRGIRGTNRQTQEKRELTVRLPPPSRPLSSKKKNKLKKKKDQPLRLRAFPLRYRRHPGRRRRPLPHQHQGLRHGLRGTRPAPRRPEGMRRRHHPGRRAAQARDDARRPVQDQRRDRPRPGGCVRRRVPSRAAQHHLEPGQLDGADRRRGAEAEG